MSPGKIAIAATAFACTTLLSVGWSEQHGAALSVASAQAVENAKATENTKANENTKATENTQVTENTKARLGHRQSRGHSAHVMRKHYGRSAYAPGPAPGGTPNLVAEGNRAAAAPNAATPPRAYPGGGPYASAAGWQGGGYASSPWGDYDCRPTANYECRPFASKQWKQ